MAHSTHNPVDFISENASFVVMPVQ